MDFPPGAVFGGVSEAHKSNNRALFDQEKPNRPESSPWYGNGLAGSLPIRFRIAVAGPYVSSFGVIIHYNHLSSKRKKESSHLFPCRCMILADKKMFFL